MALPIERQTNRLPKHLPAGSIYVVEGRGGQYGRLRVSTRYIILPGGRRVDIPVDVSGASAAELHRGRVTQLRGTGHPRSATKKSALPAKKFTVMAGTTVGSSR
ncbi:MAG: hypothetical protein ACRECV_16465 [Xanthobacteraceae bacterium]